MIGELAILNVASGDTKLTFDPSKPEEVKRASAVVQDMLQRGFALLIQVGEDDGEPLYRRAKGFDPATAEYIVVGAPEVPATLNVEPSNEQSKSPARRGRKPKAVRVPASSAKAVAVARTAGG